MLVLPDQINTCTSHLTFCTSIWPRFWCHIFRKHIVQNFTEIPNLQTFLRFENFFSSIFGTKNKKYCSQNRTHKKGPRLKCDCIFVFSVKFWFRSILEVQEYPYVCITQGSIHRVHYPLFLVRFRVYWYIYILILSSLDTICVYAYSFYFMMVSRRVIYRPKSLKHNQFYLIQF